MPFAVNRITAQLTPLPPIMIKLIQKYMTFKKYILNLV